MWPLPPTTCPPCGPARAALALRSSPAGSEARRMTVANGRSGTAGAAAEPAESPEDLPRALPRVGRAHCLDVMPRPEVVIRLWCPGEPALLLAFSVYSFRGAVHSRPGPGARGFASP